MFNFLRKVFAPKTYLGVDIGTTSIKVAEVKKSGSGKPELLNYGYLESLEYLERTNAAFQSSTLRLSEKEIAKYIRALIKQSGVGNAPVVASLPAFSAFTTLIEVPMVTEEELGQSLAFQAQQYIPIPVNDAAFDWMKVGERVDSEGNRKQQILLISIPKDVVARHEAIFKEAGLNLVALEVESVSLARSLTVGTVDPTLIIDIGSRSASMVIAEAGNMKFAGQTDFAGASLTQSIASGLNLSSRRAEELKRSRGLTGVGGEYQLSTLLQPLLDVIINEGRRVRENFESAYKTKVSRLVISGGGAQLPGLSSYVSRDLGLSAAKASPLSLLTLPAKMEPLVGELNPFFSVAVGLAIKNLS